MHFTSILAISYLACSIGVLAAPVNPVKNSLSSKPSTPGKSTGSSKSSTPGKNTGSSKSSTPGKNTNPSTPGKDTTPAPPKSKGPSSVNAAACKTRKKSKSPATGGKPPATGGKPPATGGKPPATGGKLPATGGKRPGRRTIDDIILEARVGGSTSLCGVDIRRGTNAGCRDHNALVKAKNGGAYKVAKPGDKTPPGSRWDDPDAYLRDTFDPAECDHAVELQLSSVALTNAKFCTALETILTKGGIGTTKANRIKQQLGPGQAANDLTTPLNAGSMKFFIDKTLNTAKRTLVSKSIGSTATANVDAASKAALKSYLTMIGGSGTSAAQAIDQAAKAVIDQAVKDAQAALEAKNPALDQDTHEGLVCDIVDAQVSFEGGAVNTAWTKFVSDVNAL